MDIIDGNIDSGMATPNRCEALMGLGDCHAAIGNHKEAQRCYEESAILSAYEPQLYIGLGVAALGMKLFEDAEVTFKVAVSLDETCPEAFCGLAIVYQQKRNFAKSQEMYVKSLELNNENLTALSGLFQTSRQLGSFSKVRFYLEAYLKKHQNETAIMFSLAALDVNDGRLNEAKKTLLKILALRPAFTGAINLLEEVESMVSSGKASPKKENKIDKTAYR